MSCANCGGQCDLYCSLIKKTADLVEKYYDAQLAFEDPTIVSYTLDTGQTRQVVTRSESSSLQNAIDKLLSRYQTLNSLVCPSSSGFLDVARYVKHF